MQGDLLKDAQSSVRQMVDSVYQNKMFVRALMLKTTIDKYGALETQET